MKNVIEKYMQMAEPLTEAPRLFHFYLGHLVVSMALGQRVRYVGAGSFPLYPNLWLALIGPSSLTKKSTTLRIATEHTLRRYFEGAFLCASEGSQESMMEYLEKNPLSLIAHDEFANLVSWLTREYNLGLMGVLTNLYDCPPEYRRRVGTRDKAREFIIKNPHLSIATCSTIAWFNKHIKEDFFTGGFLPRFIIVIEPAGDKDLPITPPLDETLCQDIVMDLQAMAARYSSQTTMAYDAPAAKIYCEFYMDAKKRMRSLDSSAAAPSFYARRISDLHKFAMIHCAMRHAGTMNTEDLDYAIGITEQSFEYIDTLLSDKLATTPFQGERQKVLEIIEKLSGGNGGAPRWLVLKKARMRVRDFDEIINGLFAEESITVIQEQKNIGKKTFYKIAQGGHDGK